MAIRFEDDKGDTGKAEKPARPVTATKPESPQAEPETHLPFAKPVRTEKKRKGR